MTDALGWRRKFGVLGPSTNTIVQPDFDAMKPLGVTNHYSRIFTPNANAVSNESFRAGAEVIASNTLDAVRSVMTCEPDYLVMGMSAVTFFDGEKGADRFTREVEETAGIKISIGSDACTAAMKAYGGVKRIAVLSPYWPSMNTEVARYFGDKGFTVVRDKCLQCRSWTQIAEQTTETLRAALMRARRRRRRRHRAGRHQPVMVGSPPRPKCGSASRSSPSTPRPTGMRCAPTASRTAWMASAGCWRSSDPP